MNDFNGVSIIQTKLSNGVGGFVLFFLRNKTLETDCCLSSPRPLPAPFSRSHEWEEICSDIANIDPLLTEIKWGSIILYIYRYIVKTK